ncbi:MAG: EF-P lysine aminoacylase EpmA [Halothiobacillaceae bacterium]
MTDTENWRPGCDPAVLRLRARLLRALRQFMDARDILEVETPLLTRGANHDLHVHNFRIEADPAEREALALHTSPELHMKRLLAAGSGAIWQLCKVFRAGETGPRHNPEFTMLEWYVPGHSLGQLVDDTLDLFDHLRATAGLQPLPRQRLTYREAFFDATGLDPFHASVSELAARARAAGITVHSPQTLTQDDWLDLLVSELVQRQFPEDRYTLLCDFPASQAALARLRRDAQGEPVAERCEIFQGALELANGYRELVDPAEQRDRFTREARRRTERGEPPTRVDERFMAALESGLPDCSGLSVGFDRLLMTCAGETDIRRVLTFDQSRL